MFLSPKSVEPRRSLSNLYACFIPSVVCSDSFSNVRPFRFLSNELLIDSSLLIYFKIEFNFIILSPFVNCLSIIILVTPRKYLQLFILTLGISCFIFPKKSIICSLSQPSFSSRYFLAGFMLLFFAFSVIK